MSVQGSLRDGGQTCHIGEPLLQAQPDRRRRIKSLAFACPRVALINGMIPQGLGGPGDGAGPLTPREVGALGSGGAPAEPRTWQLRLDFEFSVRFRGAVRREASEEVEAGTDCITSDWEREASRLCPSQQQRPLLLKWGESRVRLGQLFGALCWWPSHQWG